MQAETPVLGHGFMLIITVKTLVKGRESVRKPDAWKLARPVWGWGRGVSPRPTPPGIEATRFEMADASVYAHYNVADFFTSFGELTQILQKR